MSFDEIAPAIEASVVVLDGEEHVDVVALIDRLRALTPGTAAPTAPAPSLAEAGRDISHAWEPITSDRRDLCPHCGQAAGIELAIPNIPDSACCTLCLRHLRTGQPKETYVGRYYGQPGPAPAAVPPAPLGLSVDEIEPESRLATPPTGHRSAAVMSIPEEGTGEITYKPVESVNPEGE